MKNVLMKDVELDIPNRCTATLLAHWVARQYGKFRV